MSRRSIRRDGPGAVNSTWDVNTTANWKLVTANSTTTFQQSDNVQFDDTGANTAISLSGTVTPSNVQFSNNNKAYSLSGPGKISGPTALVMTGSGLVTLNTNNDYTGGTYVNGGTLQLGSGGATGSIAGNVANNALLVFNRSDAPSYAGVISGSGTVVQLGSGLLTILGNNTYGGLTTVSAGSLQFGNGGSSGAIAGNILNNSTVIFNRIDSNVYAGSITGTGSLVQQGAGTTVLTGSNTYSGGTLINNGALQIGNGGASGSIAGDVLDNGTLIANRSDNPILPAKSAVRAPWSNRRGDLDTHGKQQLHGRHIDRRGHPAVGQRRNSGGIVGNVNMGGTLAINRSDNVAIAGSLAGPGAVAQIGGGATTLSGTNGYSGGTTVMPGPWR